MQLIKDYIISPFTPLFFIDRKTDGIDSGYIQMFADTDRILIEVIAKSHIETGDWLLYSEPDHELIDSINYMTWNINDETKILWAVLSPSPGMYSVEICGKTCQTFRVTDDEAELRETTLIQYSNKNNRQRTDVVFFIDGMQYFFDWRVPGGFKDSNWSFSVDGEQFSTQYADISQLFGYESTQKKFTLGGSEGVPIWFGEMLNRILVCSHVYFDEVAYTRKESNAPEATILLDGINSFVFNQILQQSHNLDPEIEERNRIILRRVGHRDYRKITTNINRKI